MKIVYVAAAIALTGLTGIVQAEPAYPDDSIFTLDLESASGHTYFLACKTGTSLLDCRGPSIWEQTNGFPGLQTAAMTIDQATQFKADTMLLG